MVEAEKFFADSKLYTIFYFIFVLQFLENAFQGSNKTKPLLSWS